MSAATPVLSEFVPADLAAPERAAPKLAPVGVASSAAITIERATGARLGEIDRAWNELLVRSHEPNVFMDPAIIGGLDASAFTLLAWQGSRLVGVWAFAVSRLAGLTALRSPAFAHAYLATPVMDRDQAEAVLSVMLDHIARASDLPKLIALDPMRLDGPTMQALSAVLGARGTQARVLGAVQRPILASELDGKQYFEKALSSSSRKKLRQHRRRLEERGAVESMVATTPNEIEKAFEDFLNLEAAGWKGQRGTALLSRASDASSVRAMIAALAERGRAEVHALYQGGKPVASQVVLRAGATAFTWKTAYDETLGDYSPGMLLLENYTASFLADESIAMVDSCAFDGTGFMSAWSERETIGQVLIHAGRGRSAVFEAAAFMQQTFLKARTTAKALYWRGRQKWMRK